MRENNATRKRYTGADVMGPLKIASASANHILTGVRTTKGELQNFSKEWENLEGTMSILLGKGYKTIFSRV